jgi:thioredoxin-dependent peroxiredoxin
MSFPKIAIAAVSSALFTLTAVNSALATDRVKEGDKAPNFNLNDDKGKPTKLSDFAGKRIIVFFYDAEFAPVSSKQSDQQKKDFKKFKLDNTDLLGIGVDPVASHKAMNTGLPLNFHLLPDKDNKVRASYGFPNATKGMHNNYAVIVDKDGTVKKVVDGTKTTDTAESMGKALRYLGDFGVSAY